MSGDDYWEYVDFQQVMGRQLKAFYERNKNPTENYEKIKENGY